MADIMGYTEVYLYKNIPYTVYMYTVITQLKLLYKEH